MTEMTFNQAGIYLSDQLTRNWRMYLGRINEDMVDEVTGVSFTWTETNGTDKSVEVENPSNVWRFVFSLKRNGVWSKVEGKIDFKDFVEDEDAEDYESVFEQIRDLEGTMLSKAAEVVFPDRVVPKEKD